MLELEFVFDQIKLEQRALGGYGRNLKNIGPYGASEISQEQRALEGNGEFSKTKGTRGALEKSQK